jgi:hypothetical protein
MFPSIRQSNFFQSIFTNCDTYVNSTCADSINVDLVSGTASVLYKDGSIYRYSNVSRRAILKFIIDDARSFGKFINNVLKQSRVVAQNHGDMPRYVLAKCA